MTEDVELLKRYAGEQSEAAFAELTRRHVNLVYSAALRLVHGDVHSAQDVTQHVFTEVARQAKRLTRHPALVGWLYTTTRQCALRLNRTEQRRHAREEAANTMNELLQDDIPAPDWNQLRPVIEDVMHELDEQDRHAVLLRFFQNKTLNEVGAALNVTENAARMRVDRALDKLRLKLVRRGITTTATALAGLVSANAVQSAPAGFVATLPAVAMAGSALQLSTFISATQNLAMTTLQKTIIAAALTAAVGTGIYAVHRDSQLRARIDMLQQAQAPLTGQIYQLEQKQTLASDQLAALREENARLKGRQNEAEVLKLRGEVGMLRQKAASNEAKTGQSGGGLAKLMADPAMKEYMQKAMTEKMRSLYADLTKELKLTPEQTDQFLGLLSHAASEKLAQFAGGSQGSSKPGAQGVSQEIGSQLYALLGGAGCARLGEFSGELPGRATLSLLNAQLGGTPLSEEQSASLIQIIKAEPGNLTQGIVGGPDVAFLGSQTDINNFLEQVAQSNQRILQQAASFLAPNQLAALDGVLTKAIDARKLQGAAFFQPH